MTPRKEEKRGPCLFKGLLVVEGALLSSIPKKGGGGLVPSTKEEGLAPSSLFERDLLFFSQKGAPSPTIPQQGGGKKEEVRAWLTFLQREAF